MLFARSIEDNICYGLDGECRPTSEEVHAAALGLGLGLGLA